MEFDSGQGVAVKITRDTTGELEAVVTMGLDWLAGLRKAARVRGVTVAQFLEMRVRGVI